MRKRAIEHIIKVIKHYSPLTDLEVHRILNALQVGMPEERDDSDDRPIKLDTKGGYGGRGWE